MGYPRGRGAVCHISPSILARHQLNPAYLNECACGEKLVHPSLLRGMSDGNASLVRRTCLEAHQQEVWTEAQQGAMYEAASAPKKPSVFDIQALATKIAEDHKRSGDYTMCSCGIKIVNNSDLTGLRNPRRRFYIEQRLAKHVAHQTIKLALKEFPFMPFPPESHTKIVTQAEPEGQPVKHKIESVVIPAMNADNHMDDLQRLGWCICGTQYVPSTDDLELMSQTQIVTHMNWHMRRHVAAEAIAFDRANEAAPEAPEEPDTSHSWTGIPQGSATSVRDKKTRQKNIGQLDFEDIGLVVVFSVADFEPVGGVLKRVHHGLKSHESNTLLRVGEADYFLEPTDPVVVLDTRKLF